VTAAPRPTAPPQRATWLSRRAGRDPLARLATAAYFALVFVLLLSPLVVVAGASFSAPSTDQVTMSYVQFPPERLTLRWYREIPVTQFHALALSFGLGIAVALAACVVGVPAALGLVRGRFPGKALVGAVLRAPLQIPHVVIGIAFLQLYHALGDATGAHLQGTLFGLFLGHLFLATPFVIGSVGAVLQRFNPRLEEAAFILGASRWRTLRRVTLPVLIPGIFSGGLYAFIVSFTDVPVALFLAASGSATFPVELFYSMEQDFNPSALASATVVTCFALLLLVVTQRIVGVDALLRSGPR
jgi:putative spermidine/putrescine transport system permease protein